jgi:hypothetical protein
MSLNATTYFFAQLLINYFNLQIASILQMILADEIITIHRKHVINTKPIDPNENLSQDKTFSDNKY